MRKLLLLVLVLAAVAVGAWFAWAQVQTRGLNAWLAERRAEGWVAEAAQIETNGFPVRFDTRATALELADPATGLALSLPNLIFTSQSLSPTAIRAVLPPAFRVATPLERIEVSSRRFDALLSVDPGPSLGLRRADVALAALALTSSAGWTATLDGGEVVVQRAGDDPLTYQTTFQSQNLRPAQPVLDRLDPTGLLPPEIETLRVRATATFDRPWDRRAIEDRRPQVTALDLSGLTAVWGPARLEAAGTLDVDAQGRPTGRITVRATNWREMLQVARNAGVVPEPFVPTIENVLTGLAGLSGRDDTIDAPLSFQNGFVSFGPIPLGPAPRLVIR